MNRFKSPIEEQMILKGFDEDLLRMLSDLGAVLAGGAVTSTFTNSEVNDYDIYFPSDCALAQAAVNLMDRECDFEGFYVADLEQCSPLYLGTSSKSVMFTKDDKIYQLMCFKYFDSIQDIFNSFDFTCCMGAYDFKSGEFVVHDDFLKHCAQRRLVFNSNTDYPIMSMLRVDKYKEKGYTISKTELVKVILACSSLNLSSWSDLKNAIGGMYGVNVDDMFDEDEEFTIQNAINQLSELRGKCSFDLPDKLKLGGNDMDELLHKIVNIPEDYSEYVHTIDSSKYLYKCVDVNWSSPLFSKKIKYTEGEVIDTKERGKIWVNRYPEDPKFKTPYWVELEAIGDIESSRGYCPKELVVNKGKLRVNKCFVMSSNNQRFYSYLAHEFLDKVKEYNKKNGIPYDL